jgi:hypothetical protein
MGQSPAFSARIRVLRCASSGSRRFALAAFLVASLIGCSATGDFGRPRHGFVEEKLLPFTGSVSARLRGEPSSAYALTEDEKSLRARAWHFLVPQEDAPLATRLEDHAAFHRLLPPRKADETLFHRTIMGGPYGGTLVGDVPALRAASPYGHYASLTSRYNRVRDAIGQDHGLIAPFRMNAAQVIQADHVRMKAMDALEGITPMQRAEGMARICENAAIIARVHWAFYDRAAEYRYSLEHLVIEGPEREAIPAERSLMAFERDIAGLGQAMPPAAPCGEEAAIPPALKPRPLSRKG